MTLQLNATAGEILKKLTDNGFDAYAVGGCVRDLLICKTPYDYDITTSARPDEIKKTFSDYKTVDTGIKHGTVTVIYKGLAFEITTFRSDGTYSDGRHPDSVSFSDSIIEDLKRRDFTMNAIAYNDISGLVDPFDGKKDIDDRIIRAVGSAKEKFSQDALRIIRALRFKSCLGFGIEKDTSLEIHKMREKLLEVSNERISDEFVKLLCGDFVAETLYEYRDIVGTLFPEMIPEFDFDQKSNRHKYDVYLHTLHSVEKSEKDPIIRLTLFFHDIGKPSCFFVDEKGRGHSYGHGAKGAEIAKPILSRMKLSKDMQETVYLLMKYHDLKLNSDRSCVRHCLNKLGYENMNRLIAVQTGDTYGHNDNVGPVLKKIDDFQKVFDDVIEKKEAYRISDLDIDGDVLKDIGCPEGRETGEALSFLLEAVMDDEVENEKKKLIDFYNKNK